MENMRKEYNTNDTKVIFVATSDKPMWLHKNLLTKDDIFYPQQQMKKVGSSKLSLREISMIHAHEDLAVKGKEKVKQELNL